MRDCLLSADSAIVARWGDEETQLATRAAQLADVCARVDILIPSEAVAPSEQARLKLIHAIKGCFPLISQPVIKHEVCRTTVTRQNYFSVLKSMLKSNEKWCGFLTISPQILNK